MRLYNQESIKVSTNDIEDLFHFMFVVLYREKKKVVILESCSPNEKVSSKFKKFLRLLIGKLGWGENKNISLKNISNTVAAPTLPVPRVLPPLPQQMAPTSPRYKPFISFICTAKVQGAQHLPRRINSQQTSLVSRGFATRQR